MRAMTAHEKECALAALATRVECAKKSGDKAELREMRDWYQEVLKAPLDLEKYG